MAKLDNILQHFDVEEKKDIVWIFLKHDSLKELLLEYTTSNKGSKKTLQALGSMWEAYATLTFARQGKSSLFRNVLMTTMVSNVGNTS
jgi:hypothetical protein